MMKTTLILLAIIAGYACHHNDQFSKSDLGKIIPVKIGCRSHLKTSDTLTNRVGRVLRFNTGRAFISAPPPYTDQIIHEACNLPSELSDGQLIRFSARIKDLSEAEDLPEGVEDITVQEVCDHIELTEVTLLDNGERP